MPLIHLKRRLNRKVKGTFNVFSFVPKCRRTNLWKSDSASLDLSVTAQRVNVWSSTVSASAVASTVTLYVNVTIVSIETNFKINDRKRCGLRLTETKMPSRLEIDEIFPYSLDLSKSTLGTPFFGYMMTFCRFLWSQTVWIIDKFPLERIHPDFWKWIILAKSCKIAWTRSSKG